MSRAAFRRLATLCFFLTGATSLVYQVVWSRSLTLIFGAAHYSVAAVVAAYMLGLGLGSWLIGGRADRSRNPARLYALLEVAIAVYGAASPLLLRGVGGLYIAFHRAVEPGHGLATAVKLLLALGALAIPTLLMGGTLPVLSRALVEEDGKVAADVGRLYAVNTLGAVFGALIAGFWLVEHVGLLRSLLAAAGLNVAVGLAVLLARPGAAPSPPTGELPAAPAALRSPVARFALAAAFVSGFASLSDEIVWTRILALLTGSSTYAFSIILATFLAGIGLGARWSARHPTPHPALRLAWAQLLAGVGAALLLVLLAPAVQLIFASSQNPLVTWRSLLAVRAAVVVLAVLPATFGFGAAFPALVALLAPEARNTGRAVGLLYAVNTVGAILGSLAGGFLLLRLLSSYAVLRAGVLASLAIALLALVFARVSRLAQAGFAALVFATAALVLLHPAWPAHLLDSGPAIYQRNQIQSWLELESVVNRGRNQVTFFREGLVATVTVRDGGHSRYLRVNGKTDASSSGDMDTQIAAGMLPMLAHRAPAEVLIIGAGSGVTASVIAASPGVERMDLIEIEPAVIAAGEFFEDINHGVFRDARLRIHIEDGRNHLLTTTRQYDVIASEPSNPWVAGVANLFSTGYYELVARRLKPGGVFCQWVQRYDLTEDTFRRLLSTVVASFPHTALWRGGAGDTLILAAAEPLRLDMARVAKVVEALRAGRPGELESFLGLEDAEDVISLYLLGPAALRSFVADARPYRDDPPELEFAAYRDLHAAREWTIRLNMALIELKRAERDGAPPADPELPPAARAYGMGRTLDFYHEPAIGAVLLEQAVALEDRAKYRRWLGEAHLRNRNVAAAQAAWERAVELDPQDVRSLARLTRLALERGDLPRAQGLVPPPGTWDFEAAMVRCELRLAEGDLDGLLRELELALQAGRLSNNPVEPFGRAVPLLQRAADLPEGSGAVIEWIHRQIQRVPRHVEWRVLLSDLLERRGRCEEAVAQLDWLDAHGSYAMDTLLRRAGCLLTLGRKDEALAAFRRARRYEPWRVNYEEIELGEKPLELN